jgi:DNA helicase-2/ATP-dependent DNA helicase PcrA
LGGDRAAAQLTLLDASCVVGPLLNRIDVVTFDGFAWRIINDFRAG